MTQKIKNSVVICALIATFQLINAAPPKLMMLPDKTWCKEKGYGKEVERNGRNRFYEDYEQAFTDNELTNVATVFNEIMQDKGFPLVNYGAQNDSDEDEEDLEALYDEGEFEESAFEQALNNAKPDIIARIGWTVNKVGFQYSVDYRIDCVDSYSNKSVASASGTTEPVARTVSLSALLKHAISQKMDEFESRLLSHFQDVQDNGREISINIRVLSNEDDLSFNSVFEDKELATIIYDWMAANTINGQFSERTSTKNRLRYDQVRIPLKDASGRPIQARQFISQLQRFLSASPYNISCENTSSGLGQGRLYLKGLK